MDRNDYIRKCQQTSIKTDYAGAWWAVEWNDDDLVTYTGESNLPKGKYIPFDYRFGFKRGEPTHVAILHSLTSSTEYTVRLSEIK